MLVAIGDVYIMNPLFRGWEPHILAIPISDLQLLNRTRLTYLFQIRHAFSTVA